MVGSSQKKDIAYAGALVAGSGKRKKGGFLEMVWSLVLTRFSNV